MGFGIGDDPKKISQQNKKIAARIFRQTGRRVSFVQSSGPIVPPALRAFRGPDASPTQTPTKRFRKIDPVPVQDVTSVRGFLNGKPRMDRNGQLKQTQTGRSKRLSDEELRLLRERGLI